MMPPTSQFRKTTTGRTLNVPSEVSMIHKCIQWTRSKRMEERNLFRDEKLNSKRYMDNRYRSKPIQAQIIGYRIVLRKYDENGSVNRRKVRVIAKGFTQKLGIDFCNIFAPIVKLSSLRLLMALSMKLNLS